MLKINIKNICRDSIIILANLILRIFYIFPINKKSIIFISYNGSQYSCNPKYISEYMLTNKMNEYDLIWTVSDKKRFKYLKDKGYKLVRYNSIEYLYKILTSKVIVTNVSISSFLPIRKGQYVINTWHGGGAYKKALFNEEKISKIVKKVYAEKVNLYLSSCERFSDLVIRGTFNYKGQILECGLPRNDIFFTNDYRIKKKVKDFYNIDNNKKIILYAPTFRDTNANFDHCLDYKRLLKAVTAKFGGEWIICIRAHHYAIVKTKLNTEIILDVSRYPDMQELLLTADILITDYSSSIWDFSIMKKPCFLYTPDLNKYKSERNFYIDINKWHFPICSNNDELINSILNFNMEEFRNNMELHHKEWGSFENGQATQRTVELILSIIGK